MSSTIDTPAPDVSPTTGTHEAGRLRRLSISDGALQTLLLFGFLLFYLQRAAQERARGA